MSDARSSDGCGKTTALWRSVVHAWRTGRSDQMIDHGDREAKDLRNRVADNWRTLISIADCFGAAWAQLARDAAVTFAHTYHDEDDRASARFVLEVDVGQRDAVLIADDEAGVVRLIDGSGRREAC
jgi:hypothetical protein